MLEVKSVSGFKGKKGVSSWGMNLGGEAQRAFFLGSSRLLWGMLGLR